MHYHLLILIGLSSLLPTILLAQMQEGNPFIFEGYIYAEDSIPMENVHLINYRTTKIITTNQFGYFKTVVEEHDSLMVNHIALTPKIIHVNHQKAKENTIIIPYNTYQIGDVSSNDFKRELIYFEQNFEQIKKELEIPEPKQHGLDSLNANRYDNEPISPGIDLKGIFRLIKKLKKK